MAFKLTKAEIKRREELAASLELAGAALSKGIETFNEEMSKLFSLHVQANEVKYNEALAETQEFLYDVVGRLEDEAADKSELWQESDAGQVTEEFIDGWRNLSFDDLCIEEPDALEMPDLDHHIVLTEAAESR
jgi:hypothetical protein